MLRFTDRLLFCCLLLLPLPSAADPLLPPGTGGLAEIDRALARIPTHQRLLVIGAHPDDEDTTLLTVVARGLAGEAAYLSLTRGSGGQNLIGTERGEHLGVLRTEELLAARRVDGARQYFGRVYDFGYSKTLEEALTQWPPEILLEDVVRVIRRFKPQVVVAIFPADERAGHGQHQASGWVAEKAFSAAGDPSVFPEMTEEGLFPWAPSVFYRSARFDADGSTLALSAGEIEPFSGRSLFQIAMESRSQHRCQSFGSLLPLGLRRAYLRREIPPLLEEELGLEGELGLFPDLETRLRGLADLVPEAHSEVRRDVVRRLERIESLALEARRILTSQNLKSVSVLLQELSQELQISKSLVGSLPRSRSGEVETLLSLLDEKAELATSALLTSLGLVVDVTTEVAEVVPGQSLEVTVRLWNSSQQPLALMLEGLQLQSSTGWLDQPIRLKGPSDGVLGAGELWEETVAVAVLPEAPATIPYWLQRPRRGATYDLRDVPAATLAEPNATPPLMLRVAWRLAGTSQEIPPLSFHREVVQRRRDLVHGEVRRPLRAVPAIEIEVLPRQLLITDFVQHPGITITLTSHRSDALAGSVRLAVPSGWPVQPEPSFSLAAHERIQLSLDLLLPENLQAGRYSVGVGVTLAGVEAETEHSLALETLDYDHVRPRPLPKRSSIDLVALDLELPPLDRVLYFAGSDPAVGESLDAVGVPIEIVGAEELRLALDSSRAQIDALVIGSRAYESAAELVDLNAAVLDYVRSGGLLIVEFQRWDYFLDGLPPYPMRLTRRERARTTDENSPVRVLDGAPTAQWLNPLGPEDWEGWVQERGTYYPVEWSDEYTPWLGMTDPGEEEVSGSVLEARVGKGIYIYTGVAFFRQLPAGIPGAFRLFANLLGRAPRVEDATTR